MPASTMATGRVFAVAGGAQHQPGRDRQQPGQAASCRLTIGPGAAGWAAGSCSTTALRPASSAATGKTRI
jgi:hypothetical protein